MKDDDEWDEYCPDCDTYGKHSKADCLRKQQEEQEGELEELELGDEEV